MNSAQKFLLGIAAGATAAVVARRALGGRRVIDFRGRVVVITGASRGLGLVLARRLAREGARLCLLARDEAELALARQQIEAERADVMTLRCDVRRRADVRAAVDMILERWPAIDVLINNAGVIQVGPLEHMTAEDFENAMATHFWGPLHLMFESVPSMRRRDRPDRQHRVNRGPGGRTALGPYSASKFALVGLSDAVRAELAQYGIRVTTVSPGLMRTGSPLNADMKGRHEFEYAWFAVAASLPGLSVSAERAAAQILEACRKGDPELTIGLPARLAMLASHAAPSAVARAMMVVNRLLPPATGSSGNGHRKGRDSESKWAPSVATTLTDRAAVANNEV